MARYKNIGIQIDAPEELLSGPDEDELLIPESGGGGETPVESPLQASGDPGQDGGVEF
jgi:hypothetical protein